MVETRDRVILEVEGVEFLGTDTRVNLEEEVQPTLELLEMLMVVTCKLPLPTSIPFDLSYIILNLRCSVLRTLASQLHLLLGPRTTTVPSPLPMSSTSATRTVVTVDTPNLELLLEVTEDDHTSE